MQPANYLTKEMVLVDVQAPDKWALLDRMVDAILQGPGFHKRQDISKEFVLEAILARERKLSTGIGGGYAYPHARLTGFDSLGLCVAIPKPPIDFESPDKVPVRFVCMAIVPERDPTIALKIMSQFAALVQDRVALAFLTSVKDPEAIRAFIEQKSLSIDIPITARDIMRMPFADVHPNTPLRQVTRIMHEGRADAIEVVEEDGRIVGEITCDRLFKVGIPDFFTQLKSVAFISEFDPFEKYFEGEADALARDVMSDDYAALPEEATLLEIVFELIVHRHPKVYVVRGGRRIGVVDRSAVLDKVLNI